MPTITKYGLNWPVDIHALEIEFAMIRGGGKLTDKQGTVGGEGLYYHTKSAMDLLWPEDDWHRWAELALKSIIENDIVVFLGCGDSGKTWMMSKWAMLDWWVDPSTTMTMVSSTEVRGAELRIWGNIKEFFNRGKELHPWLPGKALESLHTITLQEIDDDAEVARVLKSGMVLVPCMSGGQYVGLGKFCFPAGTMVGTENGRKPIEAIKEGDVVISAVGPNRVVATSCRMADTLVRITTRNGNTVDCTPEHPFLTQWGWVKSIDINPNHKLFSVHETMQIMRQGASETSEEVLHQSVPAQNMGKTVSLLRQAVHSSRGEGDFLYTLLRSELEDDSAGYSSQDGSEQGLGCERSGNKQGFASKSRGIGTKKNKGFKALDWAQEAKQELWPWRDSGSTMRENHSVVVSRGCSQSENFHRPFIKARTPAQVPSGFCLEGYKVGCGNRRPSPRISKANGKRQSANRISDPLRVVSVEILKSSSDEKHDEGSAGYRVYNLQVAGHPSYVANGFVVHNCGMKPPRDPRNPKKLGKLRHIGDEVAQMKSSFLDAYANWQGKPNFKGLMAANPIDPEGPEGIAAQPLDGWNTFVDTQKTQVWRGKFYNALVVNFDGRDSPNFDYPPDQPQKFSYLVGRKKLEAEIKTHGKDSWHYYWQCCGKMKPGMMLNRVISRQLCQQHNAHDKPEWKDDRRTTIMYLDPAYGGGDRCVAGILEFGKDINGNSIINVHPPELVPINIGLKVEPDEQIANWIKFKSDDLQIPPTNIGYDSFGKGTLGNAFAKVFGFVTPVPINSGGRPTQRPVRFDLFIPDQATKVMRLKRCDEHYSKFITELWFSVREVIESDQMRNLPEEVMAEGCLREYTIVAGDKIEVEPKDELKERIGKSPDLFDGLAVGVEMARKLGFQIRRIGSNVAVPDSGQDDYYAKESKEYQDTIKSKLLSHV
jgi:hypothetical protein